MSTIRSRWHRFVECFDDDRIVVSTNVTEAESQEDLPPNFFHKPSLLDGFAIFEDAAKYYFETDLLLAMYAQGDNVLKSLQALTDAGVASLPFEQMVIEYDWGGPNLVLLSESPTDEECPFRCMGMQMTKVQGEDVALVSPLRFNMGPVTKDATGYVMHRKTFLAPWILDNKESEALAAKSVEYWKPEIEPGLLATLLLLNTRGIVKEVVDPKPRLNVARQAKGLPPIRRHSVIRVGHVYTKTGNRLSNQSRLRRQQPLGWRAGYTATRWIGKGRTDPKLVFVQPYLVNYNPDKDEVPAMPERIVKW